MLLPQLAESVQRMIQIRDGVAGVNADAQTRGPESDSREYDGRNEDVVIAQCPRKTHRPVSSSFRITGIIGVVGKTGIITQFPQARAQIIGAVAKTRHDVRFRIQDRQSLPDRA